MHVRNIFHARAKLESAPIFRFNDARPSIVSDVVRRVTERAYNPTRLLEDAIYHEIKRLSGDHSDHASLIRWHALAKKLHSLSEVDQLREVRLLAEQHAWDVAGNFNPNVYALAAKLLPPLLGLFIAPKATLTSLHRLLDAAMLSNRIAVQGDLERVRKLLALGTVVYVPTHVSNMDSIVFGYALEHAHLSPAVYGAGKNLFTNPVLSFFMENLGAYRVDRRLKHILYKDVLKTYSCVLLERGYHSLFFPGGTRSRSGGVERRLKLGLAGTGVEAFTRSAMARSDAPQRVFFVPVTISYLVTLEAETLIQDYLQEVGKSRYIIEDDESSRLSTVLAFMERILRHDAGVVIRFGEPLDPFGNLVDEQGWSLDPQGHRVDPITYVLNRYGDIQVDPSRDAQYTRELGETLCASYLRHTVVMPTHMVASVMMNRLRSLAGTDDLFTLLRIREPSVVARAEVLHELATLRDSLLALEARKAISMGVPLRTSSPENILHEALRAWRGAHRYTVIEEHEDSLSIGDAPLVFYYQNRLAAHGLALDVLAPSKQLAS